MSITVQSYLSKPQNLTKQFKKAEKISNQTLTVNPQAKTSTALVDKNFNALMVQNNKISFKGNIERTNATSVINSTPNLPFAPDKTEKAVNGLLPFLKSSEMIIVSPSLDKAKKDLKDNIENIPNALTRIYFVKDENVGQTVGFKKTSNDKEVMNLDEKPIFVESPAYNEVEKLSKNPSGEINYLNKGQSAYLLDGDDVMTDSRKIAILKIDSSPTELRNNITKILDFEESVSSQVQRINKRSVETIKTDSDKKGPQKLTFKDVGGQDGAIRELKKTILFPIKYPETRSEKNMRKAVLLYGPPGTGKSLLAEALANEADASFFKVNASELDSKYVGESEKNWKNLFEEAGKSEPSIIFLDEFDAIAKKRGGQDVFGDKTLNTILALMSESEKQGKSIYMVAATNNPDSLDDAATRSGRFGVPIEVGAPDLKGTRQILDIHTKHEPLDENIDKDKIAKDLHALKATGADIAAITEEARTNAFDREGLYEKMDAGTFVAKDMENLRVKEEDFDNAILTFKKNQEAKNPSLQPKKKPRNSIGYTSQMYKDRDNVDDDKKVDTPKTKKSDK